jgi:hypothetical protein
MPTPRRLKTLVVTFTALSLLFSVVQVHALFDELAQLKQELQVWETTHAADFSDLIDHLDTIEGPGFKDVTPNDWFNPYVSYVADWGIVSGYRNAQGQLTGDYGPGNPVTIAEVLKMSFRASGVDETQCRRPVRLPEAKGHWAEHFVSCGEEIGMRILQTSHLDLNRKAKRAEVIAIIHDAFGDAIPPLYSTFKDTVGHPLEADIAYAAARGIVGGYKNEKGEETGIFDPNGNINRAEVAKVIYERLKVQAMQEAATKG